MWSEEPNKNCELSLHLPERNVSWMVLLKVSCLEGIEMVHHPMRYAMNVVKEN
jgi:hypothetical protein